MADDPDTPRALKRRALGSYGVAVAGVAGSVGIAYKYGTGGGWWVLVICTLCVLAFATWTLIRGMISK